MSKNSNDRYENDGFVIDWRTGTITDLSIEEELDKTVEDDDVTDDAAPESDVPEENITENIIPQNDISEDEVPVDVIPEQIIPEEADPGDSVGDEVMKDAFGGDITEDSLMADSLSDETGISDGDSDNEAKNKKKKKRLIITLVILAVLVVVITGGMIYALNFIKTKASKVTQIDIVRTDLDINPRVAKQLKNYKNIALLGIDTRDVKKSKGSRSDAIIIVSINKKNNDVKLVSVYRDSYLNIKAENRFDKVTHAFAYGGAAETVKTLNRNLDLNIEEVVIVNWGSVANVVDALGGLKVNVKPNEIAELNKYMTDTLGTVRKKTSYVKRTGVQTLDGVQAVTYARIRKGTSGGDTARAERMRKLINAAFKKVKGMNIAELNALIDKTLPEIKTNMSDSDIISMAMNIASYNVKDSIGWPYRYGGELLNEIWYDVPYTLAANVYKLHKDLFKQDKYRPTDTVMEYSQQIVNEAGSGGY